MIYISSFFLSFFLNDARILYRILGKNLDFIKYKAVLQKLGLASLISCILINFLKGFAPLFLFRPGDIESTIITTLILIGNFLGSLPGKTDGSEFFIFFGVCCGFYFPVVQIPLALFISIWLLLKSFKISFWVGIFALSLNLLFIKSYFMFLILFLLMLNYGIKQHSHFSSVINKIKEKFILFKIKGVKNW